MYFIYSSLVGRRSFAGKLAHTLGIRARKDRFPEQARVFCWGRSDVPVGQNIRWLNHHPDVVGVVANKTKCFLALEAAGIRTVDFTTDKAAAQAWLDGGRSVFERHKLTGHSGEGIVLRKPEQNAQVGDAPLYTRRVPGKFNEYRLHVAGGDIICVQQKRKMSEEKIEELGFDLPDEWIRYRIRTYGNGWVFAVNGVDPLSDANLQLAVSAMAAVGAGSGCVDMAVTEDGLGYVIEINSAPALRSDTVAAAYANKFSEIIEQEGA